MIKYVLAALIAVVAIMWRFYNYTHGVAPNLELITMTAMLAVLMLPRRVAWLVPVTAVAVSDIFIGNTNILWFTWSAWAVTGLAALLLPLYAKSDKATILAGTGLGLLASVWFFVWTNFGVWLLADGSFYERSWSGLLASYVAGIPFFRTMFVGNLIIVPVALGAYVLACSLVPNLRLEKAPA